jgi:inhibitor of KinA sporulation pathway (predicted exonuclease)
MGESIVGHYLVVDLEATCDNQHRVPKSEMETIEIGAVMVEAVGLETVAEWESFIRPVRHPKLLPFCTDLTTITQAQVDAAPGFVDAFGKFIGWMREFEDVVWCSWGDYDRNQLRQDCRHHRIEYSMPDHLNVKTMFSEEMGLKKTKGLGRALRIAKLELLGTHHRGIDDARNIARLLPWAFGRKS